MKVKTNRKETINNIINLIVKAIDENNYSFIREALNVAIDFNSEVLGSEISEIFMAEDDEYVIVEDDVFYFHENTF